VKYVHPVIGRYVEYSVSTFYNIGRKRRIALDDYGVKLIFESYLQKNPSHCPSAAAPHNS
jgi:hypothetical protein